MTLDELKELISKRIESLDKTYEKDPGYETCKEFVSNYHITSLKDFKNIDIQAFASCLLYVKNKDNLSIEECEELISSVIDYFTGIKAEYMLSLIDMMAYIAQWGNRDLFLTCLKEKDSKKAKELLTWINPEELDICDEVPLAEREENLKKMLISLRKINDEIDIAFMIEKMANDPDNVYATVLSLIEAHKRLEEDSKLMSEKLDMIPGHGRIKNKLKRDVLRDIFKTKEFIARYTEVSSFVTREEREENKFYREQRRETEGLKTAFELLQKGLTKQEIMNARDIVKTVKNEEIKKGFLQVIYDHNKKYYTELEERLDALNHNSKNMYLAKLRTAGITADPIEIEPIMKFTLEELDELLVIVKDLPISQSFIKWILQSTSMYHARTIKFYIDKGYFVPSFVCKHIYIWGEDCTSLEEFSTFFSTIQKYNINPQIFSQTEKVLVDQDQCVETNLQILEQYNLLSKMKSTNNLDFMAEEGINRKIDIIIECNAFDLLKENLEVLNCQNMDRLILLKQMNYDLDDLEEIKNMLLSENFFISDELIEDYLEDVLPTKEEIKLPIQKEQLENMRLDELTYSMGGVHVSSRKVENLLRQGKTYYQSIFAGLKINETEYQNMLKALGIESSKML